MKMFLVCLLTTILWGSTFAQDPQPDPEQKRDLLAIDLRVGESIQLAFFRDRSAIRASWYPLAPYCVDVSADGLATAKSPGLCGVNALLYNPDLPLRVSGPAFPILIRVLQPSVATAIDLTVVTATLQVGQQFQFEARIIDQYGKPMEGKLAWRSTQPTNCAIGSASAIATGRKAGNCKIYALFQSLRSPDNPVRVEPLVTPASP